MYTRGTYTGRDAQRGTYTGKDLHREARTQGGMYTGRDVYTERHTQGRCWITTYAVVLHVITLDPIGMFTVLRYSPLDFFIE